MNFYINTDFNPKGELNNNIDKIIKKRYSFQYLITIPHTSLLNVNGESEEIQLLLEIGNIGYKIDKIKEYLLNSFNKVDLLNSKMQQISLYLSSAPIDEENPSIEVIELSPLLPIISSSINKLKKQTNFLQQQIEENLHELYLYTYHLNNYINEHSTYLSKEDDNFEEQQIALLLLKLEKQLYERIFYILDEKEDNSRVFDSWKNICSQIKNDVSKQILSKEKEEVSKKELSKGKQSYIDLLNSVNADNSISLDLDDNMIIYNNKDSL